MKLSVIIAKLKAANIERFSGRIAGAAELEYCLTNTFKKDTAFVVQIGERASPNEWDSGINQKLTESFAVIVAIANDETMKDKTGLGAYDSLYEIRADLFKALLGWQMPNMESLVYYAGSRILDINRGYLWYEFDFESESRLTIDDGVDLEEADWFDTIWTQYEMTPSADIPYAGDLPATFYDMQQRIDLTIDLNAGGFDKGFHNGFDIYTG